ncbi:hypothetical protein C6503_19055 [Candidatus Poribacteria bacterium]|nr:MAG: hypothetical protein C6503_19055 [Candidatus Poribacteria bacterium]
MNKKIQEQLDKQIEKKRVSQVVEHSEAPALTSDVFEKDDRKSAVVEVNFKDTSARLVESSDAPKLTVEVLKTKGKPVKTVEMFWDDQMWTVKVWDGKPLDIEVAHLKILEQYIGQEKDGVAMDERDRAVANLLLGKLMYDPPFSYMGEGEGSPIEARSSIMIDALCNAYASVNNPTEDSIYQVEVRRGVPADAFALLDTFEWYPIGTESKKYVDMSEDELAAVVAQKTAERQVLVPSMILDPVLSYKEIDASEVNVEAIEDIAIAEGDAYPVEALSERFLQTLLEAHRVVNIPDAGLRSLQRHFRSLADSEGQSEDGESVGNDGG